MPQMQSRDLLRKNVFVGPRRTSVSLEIQVWDALDDVCFCEEVTLDEFAVTSIAVALVPECHPPCVCSCSFITVTWLRFCSANGGRGHRASRNVGKHFFRRPMTSPSIVSPPNNAPISTKPENLIRPVVLMPWRPHSHRPVLSSDLAVHSR